MPKLTRVLDATRPLCRIAIGARHLTPVWVFAIIVFFESS